MRIKHIPADFKVEEVLNMQLGTAGDFSIYRVEKREITTQQVQVQLAAALGCRRSAVNLPALKDRRAFATQHASVKGNPPPQVQGEKWSATHAGRLDRPLRPTDILANRFTLTLRDLSAPSAEEMTGRLAQLARHGLPNYFDEQRFGSYHPEEGFIGKHILLRDEEAAVRAYLACSYPADPPGVKRFKQVAAAHWTDWEQLFQAAPQPSNYRSLLTYLRDHPQGYRRALNLIPQPLLSLFLSAYQSHLWNRIAGCYVEATLDSIPANWQWIEIAGNRLPVHDHLPAVLRQELERVKIVMPHHQAQYQRPQLAAAVKEVLRDENLTQMQLKARILKKAYLSKHQRALLLFPAEVEIGSPQADDRFAGRHKLTTSFTLPRGAYATLVIKCAAAAQG